MALFGHGSTTGFLILFMFMGFSRHGYWSNLPFPSLVDHIFIRTLHYDSSIFMALHGMAHRFFKFHKDLHHNKAVIDEGQRMR